MSSHVLITPETCDSDKQSDVPCNVCDGGLAICTLCGKAEAELDGPCVVPKSNHRYSYSQIQLYAACPLKYRLKYIDQLVPLTGESEHDLRFGRAIDNALSWYYRGECSLLQAQQAFAVAYPESDYPATLPYWSPGKTYNNGLRAITAYADTYADDNQHWEVMAVQSSQQLDEPDSADDRLVKIDLVVRDKRDGLVYGVDFKSTGKYLDKDYSAKFEIHSQIRQYVDRLQRKYGEVGGFYIDALSFRHRTKAYTPRTGPDKGVQLPAGDWYSFKRLLFNPNREAVDAERSNFDEWVRKIEGDKQSGQWTYNTDQCVRGPLVCEYHEICRNGYQWPRDEDLITNYYRQRCIRLAKDGERCWLPPHGPEIEHDSTRPVQPDYEVDLGEGEVEEAEI